MQNGAVSIWLHSHMDTSPSQSVPNKYIKPHSHGIKLLGEFNMAMDFRPFCFRFRSLGLVWSTRGSHETRKNLLSKNFWMSHHPNCVLRHIINQGEFLSTLLSRFRRFESQYPWESCCHGQMTIHPLKIAYKNPWGKPNIFSYRTSK